MPLDNSEKRSSMSKSMIERMKDNVSDAFEFNILRENAPSNSMSLKKVFTHIVTLRVQSTETQSQNSDASLTIRDNDNL